MRVLFVTHTVAMAGANRSMLQLMLELRDSFHVEPVVIMPRISKQYRERNLMLACQEHQIECHSYRYYWFKNGGQLKSYCCCLANALCYPLILQKLRGESFDVIHTNSSVISLGAFLSREKKIPHVWHLREFGKLDFGLKSLLGKAYEKWVYHHGNLFIAISKAVKEHYEGLIPDEKCRMIYNGILPLPDDQLSTHNNAKTQFFQVGMLAASKNQMEALEAVNLLVNEWGETRFHLSFAGIEEPDYTKRLHAYVDEHQLADYVSFLGERSDINRLLTKMDVGLMLSTNEAFGRVTVEYMMQGLAVIASDSGANQEIVEDGISGKVYRLGNPQDLAQQIKQLIENRQEMLQIAANGRERALNLFTSSKNTQQVYEAYQSLIG